MINFDIVTNENKVEDNLKWPYILGHPYIILIIGGSGSGKTNVLSNLINNQPDIDKIYLYAKDTYKTKYQYLVRKRVKVGLKHYRDPKNFIECQKDIQDLHKNIEEYNPEKKRKVLKDFDDMIADIIGNKKLNPIVAELFFRDRKLDISIAFIKQLYFKVPKEVRLSTANLFIMKNPSKREHQQIEINNH